MFIFSQLNFFASKLRVTLPACAASFLISSAYSRRMQEKDRMENRLDEIRHVHMCMKGWTRKQLGTVRFKRRRHVLILATLPLAPMYTHVNISSSKLIHFIRAIEISLVHDGPSMVVVSFIQAMTFSHLNQIKSSDCSIKRLLPGVK